MNNEENEILDKEKRLWDGKESSNPQDLIIDDCCLAAPILERWPHIAESERVRIAAHLEHCKECRQKALDRERSVPMSE